jgi:hypothetical protein
MPYIRRTADVSDGRSGSAEQHDPGLTTGSPGFGEELETICGDGFVLISGLTNWEIVYVLGKWNRTSFISATCLRNMTNSLECSRDKWLSKSHVQQRQTGGADRYDALSYAISQPKVLTFPPCRALWGQSRSHVDRVEQFSQKLLVGTIQDYTVLYVLSYKYSTVPDCTCIGKGRRKNSKPANWSPGHATRQPHLATLMKSRQSTFEAPGGRKGLGSHSDESDILSAGGSLSCSSI